MVQEERALQLVELLYAGAVESTAWEVFVEHLSEAFGGAAVALSIQLPDGHQREPFTFGFVDGYEEIWDKHLEQGLPLGSFLDDLFKGRFAFASENFPDEDLPATAFYREFMQPQNLCPEAPMVHLIANAPGSPLSGLAIYRREGCRAFTEDDLRLGNLLVPHLARAFAVYSRFGGVSHERSALAEVLDRLPLGVILVDRRYQPVVMNRTAEQIAALEDGFVLTPEGPRARDPREDLALHGYLEEVMAIQGLGRGPNHVMSISRPSGKRSYPVVVAPLLGPLTGSTDRESVAVVFIADPEATENTAVDFLQTLYQLTPAEAELVALLAAGRSLEEAAQERGVSLHTVRSQLKHVFAKTETRRQGELVRLVLSGLAGIQIDRE